MVLSDEEILKAVQEKLEWHRSQVKKYAAIVKELDETEPAQTQLFVPPATVNQDNEPKKFSYYILSMFEDGIPKTSRMMLDKYEEMAGREMKMPDFSSRIITMRKQGQLKTHTFPDNTHASKNYFGLPEWFQGDELKDTYLTRVL